MTAGVQQGLGGRAQGYRTVYAIFEGGGAKGITHVGALKALENEKLELVGVAGSSAGAIIAALAAVGYKADELFDESGGRDILSDQNKDPIDLLGRGEWSRLIRMKPSVKHSSWLVGAILLFLVAAVLLWPPWSTILLGLVVVASLALALVAKPIRWCAARILSGLGLLSTNQMRDTLNELLRKKLHEHYRKLGWKKKPPKFVRFRDIDPKKVPLCCRLKITASDARSGRLMMFDHSDDSVVVADAVAASAAIPFAFVPPQVRGMTQDEESVLVDGGLVSNLPAWSFREEKRALEREQGGAPVPILAFTLVPSAGDGADDGGKAFGRLRRLWRFTTDVLETGIFGSQAIVQEFVPDLTVIELPSPLGTFGFGCSRKQAAAAYRSGLDEADQQLKRTRRIAEMTTLALDTFLADIAADIADRRTQAGKPVPHLRACLVDPISRAEDARPTALRVTASANMEGDADDRLELDLRNEAAPLAFERRTSVYADVHQSTAKELWMTKYEHALVRPGLCSIICTPVFARATDGLATKPPPQRVLCLDSSDVLQVEFNDPGFMRRLNDATATMSRTLIEEVIEGTEK